MIGQLSMGIKPKPSLLRPLLWLLGQWVLWLVLFPISSEAANFTAPNGPPSTSQVRFYILKSEDYLSGPVYDSALFVLQLAESSALSLKDDTLLAEIWVDIADIQHTLGDYAAALSTIRKAEPIILTGKNAVLRTKLQLTLALLYEYYGRYDKAMSSAVASVAAAETAKDDDLLAAAYIRVASIYGTKRQSPSQIAYLNLAKRSYGQNQNNGGLGRVNTALGAVYYQQGKYDSANHFLHLAYRDYSLAGHDISMAEPLDLIAKVYLAQQKYPDAIQTAGTLIVWGHKYHNPLTIAQGYNHLSDAHTANGQLSQALIDNDSALIHSKRSGNKRALAETIKTRINLCGLVADYRQAYKLNQSYEQLNESMFNETSRRQIEELQTEYDTQKKINENILLKQDLDQKQAQSWILIGLGGVLALVVALLWSYLYLRNKALKKEQALNQFKDKMFSLLGHELRGPMASFGHIGGMINHYVKQNNQEELLSLAQEVSQATTHVNSMLDNLLNWATNQLGSGGNFAVRPQHISSQTLADLLAGLGPLAKQKGITVTYEIQPNIQLKSDINLLTIIIRNLMSNAIKFSPAGGSITFVAIKANEVVTFIVSDSGHGMTSDELAALLKGNRFESRAGTHGEPGIGLGMQVVVSFVGRLGGKISGNSVVGKGTKMQIEIPTTLNEPILTNS
jgi:signal transduction histidine kinase